MWAHYLSAGAFISSDGEAGGDQCRDRPLALALQGPAPHDRLAATG